MPHPKAKEAWEKEQERNLLYVAITRARKELWWVY
jgi:superfamily I DNA/RNA helicase